MTDITFIIVNYNLSVEINNCIRSIINNIHHVNYEIMIIDNNSTDASACKLPEQYPTSVYPNIHFYKLNENKGFGTGCNYGAKHAKSDILCFLNPDTIISEDIFSDLIDLLNSDTKVGAVGPANTEKRYFDFSSGVFPNLILELLNIIFVGRYVEAFYIHIRKIISRGKAFQVDWILGASILIKNSVFKSLNGFDEDYFLFYEEMDLFYRLKENKFRVFYFPAKKIYHIGSVSTKKDYSFFTRTFYISKFLFIKKNYPFLKKNTIKIFIYAQITSQIVFWFVFYPVFKEKSKAKIRGFMQVLNLANEPFSENVL